MGKIEEDYKKCAAASSTLDDRMFGANAHALSGDEKNAILLEATRIHMAFEKLVNELKNLPAEASNKKILADIYYDWGTHCKQQAWFHYGFIKNDSEAIQHTISANNQAIEKTRAALALYINKRALVKTQAMLTEYEAQAEVLHLEASSLGTSADTVASHASAEVLSKKDNIDSNSEVLSEAESDDVESESEDDSNDSDYDPGKKRSKSSEKPKISPKHASKKRKTSDDAELDASLTQLRKNYTQYAKASSALDDSMFGAKAQTVSGDDKEAILREALRIDAGFSQLVDTLEAMRQEPRVIKLLADVYYDWGTHCKQQAWFHYGFVSNNPEALQHTIDANTAAIEKMTAAYQLYLTPTARGEVQALLVKYQKQAQVLLVEAASLSNVSEDDVSEDDVSEDDSVKEDATLPSQQVASVACFGLSTLQKLLANPVASKQTLSVNTAPPSPRFVGCFPPSTGSSTSSGMFSMSPYTEMRYGQGAIAAFPYSFFADRPSTNSQGSCDSSGSLSAFKPFSGSSSGDTD